MLPQKERRRVLSRAGTIQTQTIYMQDRGKITDYASKNRVIYGRSDASLTAEVAMVLPFVLFQAWLYLPFLPFYLLFVYFSCT